MRHLTHDVPGVAFGFREALEDFEVEELDLYPASGEGEHLFVRVEKQGIDTPRAVRQLARALDLAPRDVGVAGLKDQRGVTRQRLSLPTAGRADLTPERVLALDLPRLRVLEAAPHGNKLRTGHLAGNRFRLRLRDVSEEGLAHLRAALERLATEGLPNRFGAQRFGRAGRNAECGRLLLLGDLEGYARAAGARSARVVPGRVRRLHLSAWQSRVFNRVLDERLDWPGGLAHPVVGDLAQKHDSGGLFPVEDAAAEGARAARFEISPTGPLPGPRARAATGEPGVLEARVLEEEGLGPEPFRDLPSGAGRLGARRVLRVPLGDLELEREGPHVRLAFRLPPGSYATALVDELAKGPTRGPDAEHWGTGSAPEPAE